MIKIENLNFSYGEREILKNVSLSISKNESISVVGMSGTGKSTLLKLICDLPNSKNQIQSGSIKIKNIDNLNFIKQNRGKIGFLFQTLSLLPNLTVEENVKFPTQIINNSIDIVEVETILEKVGLQNDKRKFVYELSGGMKTRTALAKIGRAHV